MKVILVTCMGALASCVTPPEAQTTSGSAVSRPSSSLSNQVFQEVNSYRRNHGKSELIRHSGLDRLAQDHSEYLRKNRGTFSLQGKNVSHFGSENRAINARVRYQMGAVSENVAAANHRGANAASILMKLWTTSKNHEANLCNSWTHTGIGIVVDQDGMVFATEIFGCLYNSNPATRNHFSGQ